MHKLKRVVPLLLRVLVPRQVLVLPLVLPLVP